MNVKKKVFGLLTATSLLLTACGVGGVKDTGEAANEDGTLKIGTILQQLGVICLWTPQENAIKMAFDEMNEAGGLLDGKEVELVHYDYTSVDTEAAQLATRLATAG